MAIVNEHGIQFSLKNSARKKKQINSKYKGGQLICDNKIKTLLESVFGNSLTNVGTLNQCEYVMVDLFDSNREVKLHTLGRHH